LPIYVQRADRVLANDTVASQTAGPRLEPGARVGLLVHLLFVPLVLLVKLGGDVSGFAIGRFHGCRACGAE